MKKQILVGTSGYNYFHWKNVFYPQEISQRQWLEYYAQHFNTVELNVTFYRLPQDKAFVSWYRRTPGSFKFVLKGSRFITHIKRLKDCKEPLDLFFSRASLLQEKLICILWQMPPSFEANTGILENFIKLLKKGPAVYHSFEFRNKTWFRKETYELLKNYNMNLCVADSPSFPYTEEITSSFVYLRFHGGKTLYGSEYSEEELKAWVQKAKTWLKKTEALFAFFNNDYKGFAVKNALKFKELLHEKV